ncbi:hypothetical protein AOLI_G00299670 [Acnodon oligacanthus]
MPEALCICPHARHSTPCRIVCRCSGKLGPDLTFQQKGAAGLALGSHCTQEGQHWSSSCSVQNPKALRPHQGL